MDSRSRPTKKSAPPREELPVSGDSQADHAGATPPIPGRPLGLFRCDSLQNGRTVTLRTLFANLRGVRKGEVIGEHPERHLVGTRVLIDQGYGRVELYSLAEDLFVVLADGVYDTPRVENAPGEGLIEFHLRLAGTLEMHMPQCATPLVVEAPRLLVQYQPPGIDVHERVAPRSRDSCVSLYMKPEFLSELARRGGISRWPLLAEINDHGTATVWHRQFALSPTLLYIGTSLLENPYRQGIRLLHAEAKALELLCEVLSMTQDTYRPGGPLATEAEARQLETARQMLATNLGTPMRIRDIARSIGMSESKIKRAFKARYGTTVFDYGLECRMRHALELLRCKRMSVGQVAYAVGYRHQTSFASAFQEHFGFQPSKARTQMH